MSRSLKAVINVFSFAVIPLNLLSHSPQSAPRKHGEEISNREKDNWKSNPGDS